MAAAGTAAAALKALIVETGGRWRALVRAARHDGNGLIDACGLLGAAVGADDGAVFGHGASNLKNVAALFAGVGVRGHGYDSQLNANGKL